MWLDYIHGFQLFSVAPFMFSKHILQKKKKKKSPTFKSDREEAKIGSRVSPTLMKALTTALPG